MREKKENRNPQFHSETQERLVLNINFNSNNNNNNNNNNNT